MSSYRPHTEAVGSSAQMRCAFLLMSREPSDGQERNQDNEDNPNINAHQSSPAAGSVPADTEYKESPGAAPGA